MSNQKDKKKIESCTFLRDELLKDFKNLGQNKSKLTDADLKYEIARDRKAGMILKSMMTEISIEKINQRRKSDD